MYKVFKKVGIFLVPTFLILGSKILNPLFEFPRNVQNILCIMVNEIIFYSKMTEQIDERVFDITWESVLEKNSWAEQLLLWVKKANEYNEMTIKVTNLLSTHFRTPTSLKSNISDVYRVILQGMEEEEQEIIFQTQTLLYKPRNTKQEELFKKRKPILNKIGKLFNQLGVEMFGDSFKESLPQTPKSDGKKSANSSTEKKAKIENQNDKEKKKLPRPKLSYITK